MESVAPDWDTLHRLRNRFLNASGNVGLYWESTNDLVQYHQYFASRIGWKWNAAISQAKQVNWQLRSAKILDWGCGTGIATLRILEAFGVDKVKEIILWDHSIAATSFSQKTLQEKYPTLNVKIVNDLSNIDLSDTLCLASHVLNELSLADREFLNRLFSKSQQVFWVEPGSYDSSRLLLEQREALLQHFYPIAPCICAFPCPMKEEANANHWCHFFAKPPIEAFTEGHWTRFSNVMEIDLRSLPYSFMVMDSLRSSSQDLVAGKSRLLGRPRQYKGYTRVYSCDENGHNDYVLWKREDKTLWKTIKKNKSGTLYEWTQIDSGKILSGKAVNEGPSSD